jgi:hypothetical protein
MSLLPVFYWQQLFHAVEGKGTFWSSANAASPGSQQNFTSLTRAFASSALMFVLTIAFGGMISCECLGDMEEWVPLGIVDSCFPCHCTTLSFVSGNNCNLILSSVHWFRAGSSGIDLIASVEQKLGTIWFQVFCCWIEQPVSQSVISNNWRYHAGLSYMLEVQAYYGNFMIHCL